MIRDLYKFLSTREQLQELFRVRSITQVTRSNYPELYNSAEYYYEKIFCKKANIGSCYTRLFETNLILLKLNTYEIMKKLQVKSILLQGMNYKVDGRYYNRNSPHLTNEICDKIKEKYGISAFEYYEQKEDEELPIVNNSSDVKKLFTEITKQDEICDKIKEQDYSKLTWKDLKKVAKEKGIKITTKKEIIEKLK